MYIHMYKYMYVWLVLSVREAYVQQFTHLPLFVKVFQFSNFTLVLLEEQGTEKTYTMYNTCIHATMSCIDHNKDPVYLCRMVSMLPTLECNSSQCY